MSKPKIIISVEGGIVTNVASNTDIEVAILDYDNEIVIDAIYGQDNLFKNGEGYKEAEDSEAAKFLKNINF